MGHSKVALLKWRQISLLLTGALLLFMVGIPLQWVPFMASGALLAVMAAMAAWLKPFEPHT